MKQWQFEALLRSYAGLLGRIAASYEAEPTLREDLLQDIAIALWRALPRWRGESSVKTFVARIAHNRGASHVLGERQRPRGNADLASLVDACPGPEELAGQAQRRDSLLMAVRSLPLGQRQVVSLALEGFSQAEIGETLAISAGHVAVRLHRAKATLKARLGEHA